MAGASQVALDSVLHAPGPVGGLLLTSVWLCVVVRFGGVVDGCLDGCGVLAMASVHRVYQRTGGEGHSKLIRPLTCMCSG